jgi:hypothetical protein
MQSQTVRDDMMKIAEICITKAVCPKTERRSRG